MIGIFLFVSKLEMNRKIVENCKIHLPLYLSTVAYRSVAFCSRLAGCSWSSLMSLSSLRSSLSFELKFILKAMARVVTGWL